MERRLRDRARASTAAAARGPCPVNMRGSNLQTVRRARGAGRSFVAGIARAFADSMVLHKRSLRGKVVVVNFWATWCPPCRKEIPGLKALYKRFKSQGLVVLGISDEPAARVRRFSGGLNITYPILLDPGRKVSNLYSAESIPMTFVYNRSGKLVAEAMDMRTRQQFLAMLADAGLK